MTETPDAMEAEFDTVARWTADVVSDLGPQVAVPAACRGSASPAALSWLHDRLRPSPGQVLLDSGAGMGGPAAWLRQKHHVRPTLCDPMHGACAAARTVFGFPAVAARSEALPFRDATFPLAWCLGVLCTTPDHLEVLRELHRVLEPGGRLGLLVFVRTGDDLDHQPDGNNFPTGAGLDVALTAAGFSLVAERTTDGLDGPPAAWEDALEAVDGELERRHAGHPAWEQARRQQDEMTRLLRTGQVAPRLLVAGR